MLFFYNKRRYTWAKFEVVRRYRDPQLQVCEKSIEMLPEAVIKQTL